MVGNWNEKDAALVCVLDGPHTSLVIYGFFEQVGLCEKLKVVVSSLPDGMVQSWPEAWGPVVHAQAAPLPALPAPEAAGAPVAPEVVVWESCDLWKPSGPATQDESDIRRWVLCGCAAVGISPKAMSSGIPEFSQLARSMLALDASSSARLWARSFLVLMAVRGKFGVARAALFIGVHKEDLQGSDEHDLRHVIASLAADLQQDLGPCAAHQESPYHFLSGVHGPRAWSTEGGLESCFAGDEQRLQASRPLGPS